MDRIINEYAIMDMIQERLGPPATAVDAMARQMSLIELFKVMSDDEVSRIVSEEIHRAKDEGWLGPKPPKQSQPDRIRALAWANSIKELREEEAAKEAKLEPNEKLLKSFTNRIEATKFIDGYNRSSDFSLKNQGWAMVRIDTSSSPVKFLAILVERE